MNPASRPHYRSDDALRGISRLSIRSARTAELCGMLNGLAHAHAPDLGLAWLAKWIEHHPEIHECWPASHLREHLAPVLHDPATPVQPLLHRLRLLRADANQQLAQWTTTPAADFDPPQAIAFAGKLFCFTGLFAGFANAANPREQIERATAMRGGIVHPRVVKRLDYLIVGSNSHPTWTATNHGSKIALAHRYKTQYKCPIRILREQDWSSSILSHSPLST